MRKPLTGSACRARTGSVIMPGTFACRVSHASSADPHPATGHPARRRRAAGRPPQRHPGRPAEQQPGLPPGARGLPPQPGGEFTHGDQAALHQRRGLLPLQAPLPVPHRAGRCRPGRGATAGGQAQDRRLLRRRGGVLRGPRRRPAAEQPATAPLQAAGDLPGLCRQGPVLPAGNRDAADRRRVRRHAGGCGAERRAGLELARAGAVLPRRAGPDLHPLCAADAADPLRRGAARAGGRRPGPGAVAGLRAADGGLLRRAGRADGRVRRRAEPAGAPAIGLGAGALRGLLRGVRPGHVRPV